MEIILVLVGVLITGIFLFILIEFPYYLVALFIFLNLYSFNLELPGLFDLRGLISIILFIRLVLFDKNNLDTLGGALSNRFIVLIIIFSLYTVLIDFSNGVGLLMIVRSLFLNLIAISIGFLSIINGQGKKTIILGILTAGVFAVVDLIYSYLVRGDLMIRRLTDVILSDFVPSRDILNHNFFGELAGVALIVTFLLIITKNLSKSFGYLLFAIFSLGILISTSRSTTLSVFVTFAVILFTQKVLEINFRKLFFSIFAGVILLLVVGLSYSYILRAMNISSEFSEQIYWRLVEEPLSIFTGDVEEFGTDDNKVKGTMRWRYKKYERDLNLFLSQNTNIVLFGFGAGGYTNIGEINLNNPVQRQYSSHNFYTNLISEYGIIGFILFMSFFAYLLLSTINKIKQGRIQFSLVYILIAKFFITFSDDPNLTSNVSFLLYGCVIAELMLISKLKPAQLKLSEPKKEKMVENYQ